MSRDLRRVSSQVRITTGKSYFAERRPFCRMPWKRHSAKMALCRASCQTLGKDLFAECQTQAAKARIRQSSSPPNVGGRRPLCREPSIWHSAKAGYLSSVCRGTRQRIFCFCFFELSFFVMLCVTIWNSILKFGAILTFLLYLTNLFCFFVFFRIIQIWTAGTWNIATPWLKN